MFYQRLRCEIFCDGKDCGESDWINDHTREEATQIFVDRGWEFDFRDAKTYCAKCANRIRIEANQ